MFIPTAKPDRAEIPATPDLAAALKDYKGDATVAAGEAFDPSPANIEARTARSDAGGLKLALLPEENARRQGGRADDAALWRREEFDEPRPRRTTCGWMLMRGTAKHTRQQIQDELDRLKARVNVFGGATQAAVTIETTRENLPAVMRLAAEILREPAFPASEFELLKQEQLANIEQNKSEPTQIAFTEFGRTLSPFPKGDVRYITTSEEDVADINAVTLDQAKQFYQDFYGASNATLTVIGDFDNAEIGKLAGDLFGNWKSPKPFARVPSIYKDVAAVNQSFPTPDKANAFFVAGFNLKIRDDNPDYPALLLGNYMLGRRFSEFAPGCAHSAERRIELWCRFWRSTSARLMNTDGLPLTRIYAPQNVEKLEAAFKEEIARMLKDGFTAEEVEAAKSGYLQSRQVSRAQDNELAGRLNNYLFIGRTLQFDADLDAKLRALTPEQIVAAMRRHIDPAKITIIKAGDFGRISRSRRD